MAAHTGTTQWLPGMRVGGAYPRSLGTFRFLSFVLPPHVGSEGYEHVHWPGRYTVASASFMTPRLTQTACL